MKIKFSNPQKKEIIIHQLWIGKELHALEILSSKTFLSFGYTVKLWVFEDVLNIPDGVILCDANSIIPKSEIFYYDNGSPAGFANLFRYKLLYEKGGWWADNDMICVNSLPEEDEYVFAREKNKNLINNSIIKCPKKSDVLLELYETARAMGKNIAICSTGPILLNSVVIKRKMEIFARPWPVFHSFANDVDAVFKEPCPDIPKEAITIHLFRQYFNNMIKRTLYKKFPKNSLYEKLKIEHNISEDII